MAATVPNARAREFSILNGALRASSVPVASSLSSPRLQQSDDAPTVQPRLERSLHQLEQALSTQPEIGSRRSGAVAVAAVDFSSPRLKDGLGPLDYAVLPSSSALVALFVLALDGDRRRQRGDVRRGIFPSDAAL
ncbi:hypothetical protein MTO96_022640 [Rhipicephalus appendiculatus]